MKTTLAFDPNAKQFKTQCSGKTFYLGSDAAQAEQRKAALNRYRANVGEWTAATLTIAKTIAKGQRVSVPLQEHDADGQRHELALVAAGVPVTPQVNMDDLRAGDMALMRERIAQLEAELKEFAGPRVAERSTVTLATVFDEWHAYRKQTAVMPGTNEPTDATMVEGRAVTFIKRHIPDGLKLAQLDYSQIDMICKKLASRPVSLKTGKPVSRQWARECLKIMRRVIRWSARTYGYRRPEEWEQAAKGNIKWTDADRQSKQSVALKVYSNDEIRTLYRYAIPAERACLLLALNCGFKQTEIVTLDDAEIQGTKIARYRGKSFIFAEWQIWDETIEALKDTRPKSPAKVTSAWHRLLDRVQKDQPEFRRLSFKRLCKTGAKAIRRIASGEIASMYVSHGEHTDDDLLEAYAAADWIKLADALKVWHGELDLASVQTTSTRTALPLSKIEQCKALWREGAKYKAIQKATGLSRATAYRYKPIDAEA
jgi:hypothetical protein